MNNNIKYYKLKPMQIFLVCASLLLISTATFAQLKSFSISVNKDTILFGNTIKVEFTAKNLSGKFEGPEFKDFDVLSGPNTSSSMYSINGETSSTATYSYYIKPKKEGEFFIENAYLLNAKDADKNMETSPIKIVVLANPDGIIEEDENQSMGNNFFFSFPNSIDVPNGVPQNDVKNEKKSNRKLKRI
jgi:BatD DUF11 like domain